MNNMLIFYVKLLVHLYDMSFIYMHIE